MVIQNENTAIYREIDEDNSRLRFSEVTLNDCLESVAAARAVIYSRQLTNSTDDINVFYSYLNRFVELSYLSARETIAEIPALIGYVFNNPTYNAAIRCQFADLFLMNLAVTQTARALHENRHNHPEAAHCLATCLMVVAQKVHHVETREIDQIEKVLHEFTGQYNRLDFASTEAKMRHIANLLYDDPCWLELYQHDLTQSDKIAGAVWSMRPRLKNMERTILLQAATPPSDVAL